MASKLVKSPIHPGWLVPEGWGEMGVDYRLETVRLHLWRVQWNHHVGAGTPPGEHRHDHPQLLYYRHGSGRLLTGEGTAFEVRAGSVFFIPAGCPHTLLESSAEGEPPGRCLALDFSVVGESPGLQSLKPLEPLEPQAADAVLLSLLHAGRARPFTLRRVDQVAINACIDAILEESERRELGATAMIQGHLLRLMSLCLRATQRAEGFGRHFRHTAWRYALVARRVETLLEAYDPSSDAPPPDPEVLARSCGVSPHQFNRILRSQAGRTFQRMLLERRLAVAATLLREGKLNCTEAAFAAGFNDSNYFSRAFRKVYGHPPSELVR